MGNAAAGYWSHLSFVVEWQLCDRMVGTVKVCLGAGTIRPVLLMKAAIDQAWRLNGS